MHLITITFVITDLSKLLFRKEYLLILVRVCQALFNIKCITEMEISHPILAPKILY